jgi:hypothetical protein
MSVNIFDQLKKPTEVKTPGSGTSEFTMIDLKESDFEDAPYIPENAESDLGFNPAGDNIQINGAVPGSNSINNVVVPNERVFDPDFTTDIVVDTLDTLQFSMFLAFQTRKQKNIRFKDREEYLQAISLSYLTDAELEKQENPEDKKLLVEKLKAFREAMAKINEKTSFTPDEIDRLKKPVKQLVKQHNFDIPPGLALALVMTDILSNRFIDLIMD